MAARSQPLPVQVKVCSPAVSGFEPLSVTFAVAAGWLLFAVSAAWIATLMFEGEPSLSSKRAVRLLRV